VLNTIQMSVPFDFDPNTLSYTIKTKSNEVTLTTSAYQDMNCFFGKTGPISCDWEGRVPVPSTFVITVYLASDAQPVTVEYVLDFTH
jgi:hypothetical protein